MINLETLVNFNEETIAEYAVTCDTYNKYHCIVSYGCDDISSALEDTLHRIIDAGGDEEDIKRIMCAEKLNPDNEDAEEMEDFISIDLGYYIYGQMLVFRILDNVQEYQRYCMNWYANKGISLEDIIEFLDTDNPEGIYERLKVLAYRETGNEPLGFIAYNDTEKYSAEIAIDTKVGTIKAFQLKDDKYPGISVVYESKQGGEPGAVMSYNPIKDSIDLMIYSSSDPDGDPVEIYAIK